jgi:hypothetical protein
MRTETAGRTQLAATNGEMLISAAATDKSSSPAWARTGSVVNPRST